MAFDAYHKWLGIPPDEQPSNYYRLLGVKVLETDLDVIASAADRQMAHVRTFQSGSHSAESQRLLNEISTARVALLNSGKKAEYDRQLQETADLDCLNASVMPESPASAGPKDSGIKQQVWIGLGVLAAALVMLGILAVNLPRNKNEVASAEPKEVTAEQTTADQATGKPARIGPDRHPELPPPPKPAPKPQPQDASGANPKAKNEPTPERGPEPISPAPSADLKSSKEGIAPSQELTTPLAPSGRQDIDAGRDTVEHKPATAETKREDYVTLGTFTLEGDNSPDNPLAVPGVPANSEVAISYISGCLANWHTTDPRPFWGSYIVIFFVAQNKCLMDTTYQHDAATACRLARAMSPVVFTHADARPLAFYISTDRDAYGRTPTKREGSITISVKWRPLTAAFVGQSADLPAGEKAPARAAGTTGAEATTDKLLAKENAARRAALLKKKLHGKVVYDPKTEQFTLTYDWTSKKQLQDFDLSKAKLPSVRGRVPLQGGESIRHVVDLKEVAIATLVFVPAMKGTLLRTSGGLQARVGGNNPDTMYLEGGGGNDPEMIVPDNQRKGIQPVLVSTTRTHLGFAYGSGNPSRLGKAVTDFHAGQVELSGGDVGFQYGKLVLSGLIDEKWLRSYVEE